MTLTNKLLRTAALPAALLFLAYPAGAAEVGISLFEAKTGLTAHYSFDTASMTLKTADAISADMAPTEARFRIVNRGIYLDDALLGEADSILYQCAVDDADVLIVRKDHFLFKGIAGMAAAVARHPIRVSQIIVYVIRDGRVAGQREIAKKDSSNVWVAKVLSLPE